MFYRKRNQPFRKQTGHGTYDYAFTTPFGKRTISTGTKNLEEAKKFVKEARAEEILRAREITNFQHRMINQITAGRPVITCYDVLLEWAAWQQEAGISLQRIRVGKAWLGRWLHMTDLTNRQLFEITLRHINEYVNPNDDTLVSTRRARLCMVGSFFKYAVTMYGIKNFAALARVDRRKLTRKHFEKKPKKIFSDTDFWAYIAVIRKEYDHLMAKRLEHNRLALLGKRAFANNLHEYKIDQCLFFMVGGIISRFTGLRVGDVACLEWDSLDASMRKTVEVWTRKTGAKIEMPIPEILNEYLMMLPKVTYRGKEEPFLFPAYRSYYLGVNDDVNSARGSGFFNHTFQRFCRWAGISGYSWNSLRHTFATETEAKHGINVTQHWMGHSNLMQTEAYVHREQLAEQKMRDLLAEEAAAQAQVAGA